ncbi:hypothetical protein LJC02_04355, partial [Breznakia sp. OttesenSCG-928-G09]|nr:hypothetical protein [Breznakia sp. OttesenSCG-928-G09]
ANSTDKIGDLTKLKKLKSVEVVAYSNENWDLSWLSSMKKLTSLKISDIGGKVDDFTFLYSLNNLDHLDIYSEALREMEFVHNMPKLISLSLENTSLINLEPLRNRTAMSELVVGYNGNLSNLDVISTLTGLTKLKIIDIANVHEVSKTLDLHTLRNLEEVSVDNWCMDTIADLPTIKCLEIDATGELLMDKVATLKGLETLKLRDGNLDNFEALQALPNLKHLILGADVSGYYTGGNYATMFNLPIETLEVYTSSLYLDVSQVQQNATIKKLYFIQGNNNLTKLENGNEIGDSLGIGDFSEILSKMIGVEELVILNGKVNSLEFASMMPNLKFINISDNYVKDLDALKNLKNLKFVICHDNSISNYKVLDKKVLIFK